MNFKYKLSRRLAISRILCALTTSTIVACTVTDIVDSPLAISKIVTLPTTVTLLTDESQLFSAYGITTAGDTTSVQVTWSASGGTITPAGQYTADAGPGAYLVVAYDPGRPELADTSSVLVESAAVSRLILVPDEVTLERGGSQQFAVYGERDNGDSVDVAVTYLATGGSIASDGLYIADSVPGTFNVLAVLAVGAGEVLTDTASVVITPPPPTLSRVILMPPSAWLDPRDTLQFSVFGRMSNNDNVPVSVTYGATGGAIDASGRYIAGDVTGEYQVIASEA